MPLESLAMVQRRFWRLISAPNGVPHALQGEGRRDPAVRPLGRWIAAKDEATAVERLDVYANMYFFRLLDVLRGDFPRCVALVGEERFHNLVTDYLLAHPPDNPSLRYLGARLPAFMRDNRWVRPWPFVGALAELEWARLSVFDEADVELFRADQLGDIPPEAWPELAVSLIPAARLLTVERDVCPLWQRLGEDDQVSATEASALVADQQATLLVWRRGFRVVHRRVDGPELDGLTLVQQQAPFAALCLALTRPGEEPSAAVRRAGSLLRRWVETDLIRRPI